MKRSIIIAALVTVFSAPAFAHDWYSGHHDPVYRWSCCGGHDCATWTIRKGSIKAEATGYRVTLTLDEARAINPYSMYPVDALVVWNRVQASEDGNFHLCIMASNRTTESGGIYCLFAPPST